jgi:hypothetical protein
MPDLSDQSLRTGASTPGKPTLRRRTVGAVLFVFGLAMCVAVLYQPPASAPVVRLTNGPTGGIVPLAPGGAASPGTPGVRLRRVLLVMSAGIRLRRALLVIPAIRRVRVLRVASIYLASWSV